MKAKITKLVSQVVDTVSQTIPFSPLAQRPTTPDPFVEDLAVPVCIIEELADPVRIIEELAVPVCILVVEEPAVPDQDLLKRCILVVEEPAVPDQDLLNRRLKDTMAFGAEIIALLQSLQGQIITISSQGAAFDSKQSVVLRKIDEVNQCLDSRIDSLDAKFLDLELENNRLKEQLCALGLRIDAGGSGSSSDDIKKVIIDPKKAKFVATLDAKRDPKHDWLGTVPHEAFVVASAACGGASTSCGGSGADIISLLQFLRGQITTIISQGAAIDSKLVAQQSVVLGKIDEVKQCLDSRTDSLDAKFLDLEFENYKLKEQLRALGLRIDAGGSGSSSDDFKHVIVEEVAMAASAFPRVAVAAAAPPAPLRSRLASAPADMRFVSRKVFIRGWCSFGEETTSGLSQVQALRVANDLINSLSSSMQSMLEVGDRRCVAPFFKNRQITVNISAEAPHDSAYSISRALNELITSQSLHIGGKPLYCTPDAEQRKKQRNGSVFKASEVLLRTFGLSGDLKIVKDWPSGSLYVSSATSGDVCVGKHLVASGWVWSRDLLTVWPNANLDTLSEAMNCQFNLRSCFAQPLQRRRFQS